MADVSGLGFSILDSSGAYATKYSFFDTLQKYNPEIVIADGHGSPNSLTGQSLEEVLTGCVNNEVLSGRFVAGVSCLTGQRLGPDSRDKKAHAYIGFVNEFSWVVSPPYDPATDPAAMAFKEVIRKLVLLTCQHQQKRIILKEVYDGIIREFERWERYYSVPPGAYDPYAAEILLSLRSDKKGVITVGEEKYAYVAEIPIFPLAPLSFGVIASLLPLII